MSERIFFLFLFAPSQSSHQGLWPLACCQACPPHWLALCWGALAQSGLVPRRLFLLVPESFPSPGRVRCQRLGCRSPRLTRPGVSDSCCVAPRTPESTTNGAVPPPRFSEGGVRLGAPEGGACATSTARWAREKKKKKRPGGKRYLPSNADMYLLLPTVLASSPPPSLDRLPRPASSRCSAPQHSPSVAAVGRKHVPAPACAVEVPLQTRPAVPVTPRTRLL